jgi:hypothetical protein
MPWNPAPITGLLPAWMKSQSLSTSTSFSYKPLAKQIGQNYHLAAATVQTTYGAPVLKRGTARTIQLGFEASFQLAQEWLTITVQDGDYTVKQWNNDMPNSVWAPAAKSIVKYWTGGTMATVPPPPGGGVGTTNKILVPGLTVALTPAISAAFKLGKTIPLCTALNVAFIAHLKTISGTWVGFAAAGTPPPPFAFPWVTLV